MLNGTTTRSPACELGHLGADLLDDPHRLVAEDVALAHERAEQLVQVEVGAADPGRGDPDDRVGRLLDRRVRDGLDADVPLAVPGQCLHARPPLPVVVWVSRSRARLGAKTRDAGAFAERRGGETPLHARRRHRGNGNVGTALVRALAADDRVESVLGIARRRPDARDCRRSSGRAADVACDELDAAVRRRGRGRASRLADPALAPAARALGRRTCTARRVSSRPPPRQGSARSCTARRSASTRRARSTSAWTRAGRATACGRASTAGTRPRPSGGSTRSRRRTRELRVVRIRPGLVFQRDAASGIRRLFAGPLLPTPLLRPGLLRVVPDVPGLRVQAVHADDVARAYSRPSCVTCAAPSTSRRSPCSTPPRSPRALGARTVPRAGAAARALDRRELAAASAAEPAGLARPRRSASR